MISSQNEMQDVGSLADTKFELSNSLRSATPDNIDDYSLEDLLELIDDTSVKNVAGKKVRLNLTKMLYDVLGLTLTPDVALATIAEPQSLLALATAGGGKTTWAQVKAILQKLCRKSVYHPGRKIAGDAILCLVYNKHNVQDMQDRHKSMVSRLQSANIKGLDIDSDIHACTMHSFCDFWRRSALADFDLLGCTLIQDAQCESFMQRAIKITCKVHKQEDLVPSLDANTVYGLYCYYKESLIDDIEELRNTSKYQDLNISIELLSAIFAQYEKSKKMQRRYDFVDLLIKFNDLLINNQKFRARVQEYYEYVIADEVQDFTPLMWSILKQMVSDGTPLTCIGDEDQNIYSFRGANIHDILDFKNRFSDSEIYTLKYNRRCRQQILNEAKHVVEMNSLRFHKEISGIKDGGTVNYIPYNSVNGQLINVVRTLQEMNITEREDTVVCYRNGNLSTILADMLVEEDIQFNVINSVGAFGHELYRHLLNILDSLEMSNDRNVYVNLYKVLPCKRDDFFQALGYDPYKKTFSTPDTGKNFWEIDYGKLSKIKSFQGIIDSLQLLSESIETLPLNKYIDAIKSLLCKYFWNFKKEYLNKNEIVDEIMEERVFAHFRSPLPYPKFFNELQQKRSRFNGYSNDRAGVTLSTFHSLKGLEFKNVIVIFMENSIFPNVSLLMSKDYDDNTKQVLLESETRLWYVAVTRAIDSLTVYYDSSNPSLYVQCALDQMFPKCELILNNQSLMEEEFVCDSFSTEEVTDFSNCAKEVAEQKANVVQIVNMDSRKTTADMDKANDLLLGLIAGGKEESEFTEEFTESELESESEFAEEFTESELDSESEFAEEFTESELESESEFTEEYTEPADIVEDKIVKVNVITKLDDKQITNATDTGETILNSGRSIFMQNLLNKIANE